MRIEKIVYRVFFNIKIFFACSCYCENILTPKRKYEISKKIEIAEHPLILRIPESLRILQIAKYSKKMFHS